MRIVHVAAGVVNQTPLDWEGNRSHLLAAIAAARTAGVDVLCLPELAITGYGCEDAFFAPDVCARALNSLERISRETDGMIVSVGLPVRFRGAIYNAAALLVDGQVAGLVAKRALAGDGIHYEPRWFKPWPAGVTCPFDLGERSVPIGDLLFDVGGIRIGFEICEDAWVANRPGIDLAARAVDIILNPSASHFAFGKQRIRERFVLEGSRAFHATYVYSNLLGNEAGRAIYDGGALVAQGGHILARGPRFGYELARVTSASVDVDLSRTQRAQSASTRNNLAGEGAEVLVLPFRRDREKERTPIARPVDGDGMSKEEEFTHAVVLGLFDYMIKSRSRGFVVSLSGGADSAAVAALAAMTVDAAERAQGAVVWHQRAPYLNLPADPPPGHIQRELLTCVYQATENSSMETQEAAAGLAKALGATFHRWEIDDLVRGYRDLAEAAAGRPLTWEADDLALQNIQARARAPGIWMLANIRGALLLSTSNRSESAVGYATMDGDTCGGLSPIAGIDKAFLRHWLRWLETEGSSDFPPLPALRAVNGLEPTAELRPPARAQTDEGDLMPYDLLDAIEGSAIREKRSPLEVYLEMTASFPKCDRGQLRVWVRRFFELWSRNQWKRERYAPSFHLDDKNLDPKTWCRFPILSGGFAEELAELDRTTEP